MIREQQENQGGVVLYQTPDGKTSLEVRLEGDTVWLTQAQMAELFENTKQNISLHTRNIFREQELEEAAVVKESLTTARDGKKDHQELFPRCHHPRGPIRHHMYNATLGHTVAGSPDGRQIPG